MTAGRLIFPVLRWREQTGFDHEDPAIDAALEFGAGGFLVFGGTADSVFAVTKKLRAAAGRPLLIAADLERGAGQQVGGLDELPPPLALASLGDPAVLRGAGVLTGLEALSVGINWVLAPVVDLDVEPQNPIVQTRAFGADPGEVGAAAAAWIVGCEASGALACAKHFPGHGRTLQDSHDVLPRVEASAELLERTDLEPFRSAIAAGVSSVMTAHVSYPSLDPTGTPATFSAPILTILRERMGFEGLIVADSLRMAGARAHRPPIEAARAALEAGVDLLLDPEDPAATSESLTRAAAADVALAARLERALQRYAAALQAAPLDELPERLPAAGSSVAAADWLLAPPLLRGEPPRLSPPLELVLVDDDEGDASRTWIPTALAVRGIPLGPGGSKLVLAFAEPRASRGRAGFGAASRAALARGAPDAALVVLFAHPRLLAEISGTGPVLLAWHPQRLMQEAVARWVAGRIGAAST